jgi:hypothetical protein
VEDIYKAHKSLLAAMQALGPPSIGPWTTSAVAVLTDYIEPQLKVVWFGLVLFGMVRFGLRLRRLRRGRRIVIRRGDGKEREGI